MATIQSCVGGLSHGIRELQRKSYEINFDLSGTDYDARENIGSGTYGIVCLAVNRRTTERVAIKKVFNIFDNTILAVRTYREMKILKHFQHDNIIRIREILAPSDQNFTSIYFVFDLMESDLHHIIRSPQPLTDEHVRYFLYQILRGLKYIHSANVIHRDLKPGNLLVNQDCELKIGDFGMARPVAFANDDFSHQTPLMTQYVATRWYRAPELMLFRSQYTVNVDMWSVGCIFAEMLARRPIFPGNDLLHQLKLIINVLGAPNENFIAMAHSDRVKDFLRKLEKKHSDTFRSLYPNAHPKAVRLLEKMLQWNPHDRISVEDALKDLYLNAYHSLDNEPICSEPLNFDNIEEKTADVDALRNLIYNDIMAQFESGDSSVAEGTLRENAAAGEHVKTTIDSSACVSGVVPTVIGCPSTTNRTSRPSAAVRIESRKDDAVVCKRVYSAVNGVLNKPVWTVTRQLDGRVLVSLATEEPTEKKHDEKNSALKQRSSTSRAENTALLTSKRSVGTGQKVPVSFAHRNCTKPVCTDRTKSTAASRYESVVPSTVHSVAAGDISHHMDATGQSINAKAILRATILSGRRKAPVTKPRRGRPRKSDREPRQDKQANLFLNLSDEDKNMLARWKQMQNKPAINVSNAIDTSLTVSNNGLSESSVNNNTQCNGVQDVQRVSCTADSLHCAVTNKDDTDIVLKPVADLSDVVLPDSSDLALIDQFLHGYNALMSSSPVTVNSNATEFLMSPPTEDLIFNQQVDKERSDMSIVPVPTMAERYSFESPVLNYVPTQQFRDALTLVDIVGTNDLTGNSLTMKHAPSLHSVALPVMAPSNHAKLFPKALFSEHLSSSVGFDLDLANTTSMTCTTSRDVTLTSMPSVELPIKEELSLSPLMQIGSSGSSGSGYGIGLGMDTLPSKIGLDGELTEISASLSWLNGSGKALPSSELDAVIDQALNDSSWMSSQFM